MNSTLASASRAEALLLFALGAGGGLGCEAEPCANLPVDCTPLYEPTFENVWTNTLKPTCAAAGASCHASEGLQAGLDFGDIERAHASFRSVTKLEDVACSPILARLESTESGFGMPPGRQLSAEERCALRRYIEGGALR